MGGGGKWRGEMIYERRISVFKCFIYEFFNLDRERNMYLMMTKKTENCQNLAI